MTRRRLRRAVATLESERRGHRGRTHQLSWIGGTQTYILTVAEHLEQLGHEVTIYALEWVPPQLPGTIAAVIEPNDRAQARAEAFAPAERRTEEAERLARETWQRELELRGTRRYRIASVLSAPLDAARSLARRNGGKAE